MAVIIDKEASGPTKVSILGKETIVVDYNLFNSFVAADLIQNVKSSTYVLITDTNLAPVYVPTFQDNFQRALSELKSSLT